MFFDLIIISFNTRDLVCKCISSALSMSEGYIADIIVVDNNSSDDTVEFISKSFPQVKIIANDENLGYSKAINKGAALSTSPYLLLSNSDIEFLDNSIKNLALFLEKNPDIALSGVRQVYPNLKWQYSFGDFLTKKNALKDAFLLGSLTVNFRRLRYNAFGIDSPIMEIDYADGGMIAVKRADFMAVAGFDEDFFFYAEDADFCQRIKNNGGKVVFFPGSRVIHHRGASYSALSVNFDSVSAIAKSKKKFALKHMPEKEFLLYAKSQIIKDTLLGCLFSILSPFSKKIRLKKEYYSYSVKIWKKISDRAE